MIIPRSEHSISRADISEHALKVLYRLHKNGFQAYLVGGGVRDLLLSYHPKDFDVVTDATPEKVRSIFSNCRLIGRRFRLAHVFFGRHIVEVATFRGPTPPAESNNGLILRDNVYGTLEEDAWRRDFTVNALYYNIADFSLVDYTGGLADLKERVLRMIGSPPQRLREDPVRLLRAIRFASKLDLQILPDLQSAMREAVPLLAQVSPARLFEEVLKMFQCGAALTVYEWLQQMGLFKLFFIEPHHLEKKWVERVIITLDQWAKVGNKVTPDFLLAALLWKVLSRKIKQYSDLGDNEFVARLKAMNTVLAQQSKLLNVPKRLTLMIKEIWTMQFKLLNYQNRRAARLLGDYRFKTSHDLLVLRAQAGEPVMEALNWWAHYMEGTKPVRLGPPRERREIRTPEKSEKSEKLEKNKQTNKLMGRLEAESPFREDFQFD